MKFLGKGTRFYDSRGKAKPGKDRPISLGRYLRRPSLRLLPLLPSKDNSSHYSQRTRSSDGSSSLHRMTSIVLFYSIVLLPTYWGQDTSLDFGHPYDSNILVISSKDNGLVPLGKLPYPRILVSQTLHLKAPISL